MIQLHITKTGKGYSPKDKWQMFDEQTKYFSDITEAKNWLKEEYGKAKRTPMYQDTKDGKPKKTGYVIGFRNSDISHLPVNKWIEQDWVEFREVKTLEL
jgi:hypothetical protein